jgi:hypothetical protein
MNHPLGRLYLGDNLAVLHDLPSAEGPFQLVYLDPPFASGKHYALLPGVAAATGCFVTSGAGTPRRRPRWAICRNGRPRLWRRPSPLPWRFTAKVTWPATSS